MELNVLKKKIDGYRAANGSIKKLPPELLLELRQTWEHYTGSADQFRSELGVKTGTLRNLLVESKKLNHVIAGAGAIGLAVEPGSEGNYVEQEQPEVQGENHVSMELVFGQGPKLIRLPNGNLLIDFLKKAA